MKRILLLIPVLLGSLFAKGQIQFQKTLRHTSDQYTYHIAATKSGNLIATGYTEGSSSQKDDAFLMKFDRNGKVVWGYQFGDSEDDYSWDVKVAKNQDILSCGYTESFGLSNTVATISRLDSNGNLIWLQGVLSPSFDIEFYRIIETSTGHLLATGLMKSSSNKDEIVLVKFSPKGKMIWSKTFGTSGSDEAMGLIETSSGHYLLAGLAEDPNGFGKSDFAMLKVDTAGRIVWSRIVGGTQSDRLNDCLENDGKYYFLGWSQSEGNGENDIAILSTDTAGKLTKSYVVGSTRSELAFNFLFDDTRDQLVITGYSELLSDPGKKNNRTPFLLRIPVVKPRLFSINGYGSDDVDGHWPTGLAETRQENGYYIFSASNSYSKLGDYDMLLIKTDSIGTAGCKDQKLKFNYKSTPSWKGKTFGAMTKPLLAQSSATLSSTKFTVSDKISCCHTTVPELEDFHFCKSQRLIVGEKPIPGYSYEWFAKGQSISKKSKLEIYYGNDWTYQLKIGNGYFACGDTTLELSITTEKYPELISDTIQACDLDTVEFQFDSVSSATKIYWKAADQTVLDSGFTFKTDKPGSYSFDGITVKGCTFTNNMVYESFQKPILNLSDSYYFCQEDSFYLSKENLYPYYWIQKTDTLRDTSFWVMNKEILIYAAHNVGCTTSQFIVIAEREKPSLTVNVDSVEICQGDFATLKVTGLYTNYKFLQRPILDDTSRVHLFKENIIKGDTVNVGFEGKMWFAAFNKTCMTSDSVIIEVHENPVVELGKDIDTCHSAELCFVADGDYKATYWNGSRTPMDTFCPSLTEEKISVQVYDVHNCVGFDELNISRRIPADTIIEMDTIDVSSYPWEIRINNMNQWLWIEWSEDVKDSFEFVVVNKDGWYKVSAGDSFGCTSFDSVFVQMVNATDGFSKIDFIHCFPNPATTNLHLSSSEGLFNVVIFSLDGKRIISNTFSQNENEINFDISALEKGIYILEASNEKGQVQRMKVLKK